MKIALKNSPLFITDNSNECDSNAIFLATKSSAKYRDAAKENGAKEIITPKELKNYLSTQIKIIGITGTNGKTTTAALLYSILMDLGYSCALLGTRGFFINDTRIKNKGLTTPSLLELYGDIDYACNSGCAYFVMEVSSHAIDQERIEGLEFDAKILTNITSDHLDYHKNLENYFAVKNSFFQDGSFKVINKDQKHVRINETNYITYGIETSGTANVLAYSLNDGIDAKLKYGNEIAFFHSDLIGRHNLYNILAAVTTLRGLGLGSLEEICEKVENFGGVMGRGQTVSKEPKVVVDFAHTEDGMRQIFESFPNKNLVCVFGAGGDRDKTKRPRMGMVAALFCKKIFITNDNPRSEEPPLIAQEIAAGIKNKPYEIILDREEAIKKALASLEQNDVLLLLGKGDEETMEIQGVKYPFSDIECVKSVLNLN